MLGEERLHLDLAAWADSIEASARVKADLLHDAIAGEFDMDLREAYVDYTAGAFDVRLGRQITTWGVGDLLFIMEDHGAYRRTLLPGFPAQKAYRDIITLRLTQLLQHQTWRLSLFAFYSPTDRDFLIRPVVSYKLSDSLSATLGANIFGGAKGTTFFGRFDENDNVYVAVRFDL